MAVYLWWRGSLGDGIIGDVTHDISHVAVEDTTEHIDRVRTDAFVPFQSSDLSGAYVMILDEGVLGDALFFHEFPKIIIRYHNIAPFLLTS